MSRSCGSGRNFFGRCFCAAKGKILGRFDGRVTSEDGGRQRLAPDFDPSLSHVIGAFAPRVNAYIRGELGYESDHPYRVLTGLPWKYTTYANKYLAMEPRLADAMKQNPKLRVLVLTAHRDLAVPPDAIRYSIEHLPIPNSLRANIHWVGVRERPHDVPLRAGRGETAGRSGGVHQGAGAVGALRVL